EELRQKCLNSLRFSFIARLGSRAFRGITGEIVNVALVIVDRQRPLAQSKIAGVDVQQFRNADAKSEGLISPNIALDNQLEQLQHVDWRIVQGGLSQAPSTLAQYAESYQGIVTGDLERFVFYFWEVACCDGMWEPFRTAVLSPDIDDGLMCAIRWEKGAGSLHA